MSKRYKDYKKIIILFILFISVVGILVYKPIYSKIQRSDKNIRNKVISKDIDIKKEKQDGNSLKNKENKFEIKDKGADVLNIALFGIDRRSSDEKGRSDCIIILSINKKHNNIKIASLMRDTYVKIKGHGMTKINHAYAYGGPKLAMDTINENFKLSLKNYVVVDFEGIKKIIDELGGVEIYIKDYEVPGMEYVGIHCKGKYNLNGTQALAYSRIRYEGNGDYERTERQRIVLSKLIDKIKSNGITKYPQMVEQFNPYVETNIPNSQILKIGFDIFTNDLNKIKMKRFPEDNYCEGKRINGVWYLVTDLNLTTKNMHKFIFADSEI